MSEANLNLALVAIGALLFSLSLHMRRPGEPIAYGATWGYAQNLTTKGRIHFFIGEVLVLAGIVL